ncbi:MAG: VWA domain-containing protein [Clostridia bacterium]|nr:VWA domain-containing protein [Clostridia bacterium]
MKKGLTELVFILDRSGSMAPLATDTIGGFNSMIARQQKEDGECLVSTVLFANESALIHDRIPLSKVPELTDREYYAGGCTALFDAVGGTIRRIETIHRYAREEDVPEKTLFVITTDGLENASRQFSGKQVRKLVEEMKQKRGWEFVFLAANIDAEETAEAIGISRDLALNYTADKKETARLFRRIGRTVGAARACAPAEEFKAALRDDIE